MSRPEHLIEQLFVESLSPEEELALRRQLRDDPAAHARYDRLRALTRVAGGAAPDEPTDAELQHLGSLVRVRLTAETAAADVPEGRPVMQPGTMRAARHPWGWRRLWPVVAVAATAALAMVLWPRPLEHSTIATRGAGAAPPLCTIEAYAVPATAASAPLGAPAAHPEGMEDAPFEPRLLAAGDRIKRSSFLQLRSHSTDPELTYLYVFGLDARMMLLDYYPRPSSTQSVAITPGAPASLGRSIRLTKRHRPGPLKIVALCSRAPLQRRAVGRAVGTLRAAGYHLDGVEKVPVEGVVATTVLDLEVVP